VIIALAVYATGWTFTSLCLWAPWMPDDKPRRFDQGGWPLWFAALVALVWPVVLYGVVMSTIEDRRK